MRTVSSIIAPRLYNTFFLAILTAIIAVPLSLGLGHAGGVLPQHLV
jgi:peptide/nickel transport system permease protein